MYKVEGHEQLERDGVNSAIVNTNEADYLAFMVQYHTRKNSEDRVKELEVKVEDMSTKLDKILELLGSK